MLPRPARVHTLDLEQKDGACSASKFLLQALEYSGRRSRGQPCSAEQMLAELLAPSAPGNMIYAAIDALLYPSLALKPQGVIAMLTSAEGPAQAD